MARFVPFLLLLLAIAIVLRVDLLFVVFWFVLGLYVLSRLWTRRGVHNLNVRRLFADHAFTGDDVVVDLTIQNAGRLPIPWLEISESMPMELRGETFPSQAVSLGPHKEQHFRYTLRCRRRGSYSLGPLRAETGDLLGIEDRVITAREARTITVYPRVVPLHELGLPTRSAMATRAARTPLFEDTTRVMGVRDYQPGDSLRRIHWTATARMGRMVVKQYQPAITRETLICLDLDSDSYEIHRHEASEMAIVAAASLANHMIVREGLPAGLMTEARDPLFEGRRSITLPPRSERAQLMSILEVLARVQPAAGGRFADLVRRESTTLAWGSTVIVITGRVGADLVETMLYLKRSGHAAALILVQPEYLRASARGMGGLAGIQVHHVWTDQELVAV